MNGLTSLSSSVEGLGSSVSDRCSSQSKRGRSWMTFKDLWQCLSLRHCVHRVVWGVKARVGKDERKEKMPYDPRNLHRFVVRYPWLNGKHPILRMLKCWKRRLEARRLWQRGKRPRCMSKVKQEEKFLVYRTGCRRYDHDIYYDDGHSPRPGQLTGNIYGADEPNILGKMKDRKEVLLAQRAVGKRMGQPAGTSLEGRREEVVRRRRCVGTSGPNGPNGPTTYVALAVAPGMPTSG